MKDIKANFELRRPGSSLSLLLSLTLLLIVSPGCDFVSDIGGGDDNNVEVDLHPVLLEGDWGYVNSNGRMMIEPDFSYAWNFSEGLAAVRVSNWSRGYINPEGEFVIEPQFSGVRPFSEGLAAVQFDGRWGYIDKSGTFVINPQYRSAAEFSNGRAFIRTSDWDWEYVDKNGNVIRTEETPNFDENEEPMFENGLALVTNDGSFGYIDENANPFIPLQYSSARAFADGRAAIKISDRWGYIDTSKNNVISPQYISAGSFGDGLAPVRQSGNMWGYINKSGALVISEQYEEAREFSQGRAAVMKDGKWGFINTEGNTSTSLEFDRVDDFENGLARVYVFTAEDEKMGYVDQGGKYVWFPTD